MKRRRTPPAVFWMISMAALLWSFLGLYFWLAQNFFMTEEIKASLSYERLEMLNNAPSWGVVVFGIATIFGVLGSLFLLMRSKFAKPIFIISLIAIIIQMLYRIFIMHSYEVMGTRGIIIPLIIIGVSVFLYLYSKNAIKREWII